MIESKLKEKENIEKREEQERAFYSFIDKNIINLLIKNKNQASKNKILKDGFLKKIVIPSGNKKKILFTKIKDYVDKNYENIEVLDDYNDKEQLLNDSVIQHISYNYLYNNSYHSGTYRVYYL